MRYAIMGLLALVLSFDAVHAQDDPKLRPLSEHMAEINAEIAEGKRPLGPMRYVFRRCAATFSVIAAIIDNEDTEVGDDYRDAMVRATQIAHGLEVEMGAESEQALETTAKAVGAIVEVLTERAQRNMAVTGNWFVDDPLLRGDLELCAEAIKPLDP